MDDYLIVLTTTDSAERAESLSRSAVESRLAACGQVLGPITSTYWWQGNLETAPEWQIQFKTTRAGYDALAAHLIERHHYDEPEIVATPILAGSSGYLEWIRTETRA
jgi:periplasmic divalent cation tolerance protein